MVAPASAYGSRKRDLRLRHRGRGSLTTITPAQCRAARALLRWSQTELAEAAKVSRVTLAGFESEGRCLRTGTLVDIRKALEAVGVIFIEEDGEGPGVRLRKVVP